MEIEEKKIKTYKVDGLNSEVDAISIVEFPAIEQDFVYLNKQKAMFSVNEEKRMLFGPVLIPDFPIYRNNGYEEFNIVFGATAIEQLSKRFMTESRNRNWTTEHSESTDALSLVESWIKIGERDKSVQLGFDVPKGTWMAGVSVNDNTLWEQIKNGQYKGFSVESFLNLEEIENNFNKHNRPEMDKEEKMNKFMEAFRSFLSEFLYKEDEEVEMNAEEPQAEAEEPEAEPEEEATEEVQEEQEPVQEEAAAEEEPVQDSEKENLESQLEQLKSENESLKEEIEKLSKQPSADPVNVNANKASSRDFLKQIANKF